MKGKVKWFNTSKGFGYIESSSGDVFVHYTQIQDEGHKGFKNLREGQEVEFDLYEGIKGKEAKSVKVIT